MRIQIITAPTVEPVSLAETKEFLRIDADLTTEDSLINSFIQSARLEIEQECGRALAVQTVRAVFDRFPARGKRFMPLPRAPLISITSVEYIDADHTLQTWDASNYRVENAAIPGGIYCITSWPTIESREGGAVRVTYQCGYSVADGEGEEPSEIIPELLKVAIYYTVNHWYENRDQVIVGSIATPLPRSVKNIIAKYKVYYNAPGLFNDDGASTVIDSWL